MSHLGDQVGDLNNRFLGVAPDHEQVKGPPTAHAGPEQLNYTLANAVPWQVLDYDNFRKRQLSDNSGLVHTYQCFMAAKIVVQNIRIVQDEHRLRLDVCGFVMNQEEIKAEAIDIWERLFSDIKRECQYDKEFFQLIDKEEEIARSEVTSYLQPWLHILEDSIQWLANLTGVLDRVPKEPRVENDSRAACVLVGASCAYAVALRRLVLSGLDSPARATLRSLDEHLMTCILLLHDRELSRAFKRAEGSAETNDFWYKNLNTKSIKKRLSRLESELGIERHVSASFREWREEEIQTYSQAIHPSYVASALTFITSSPSSPDMYNVSILGKASVASERTLSYACKTIYYFSRFGFFLLFNEHRGQKPLITVDKEDEMQQVVVIGRDVLHALNDKYWGYRAFPQPDGEAE